MHCFVRQKNVMYQFGEMNALLIHTLDSVLHGSPVDSVELRLCPLIPGADVLGQCLVVLRVT